MKRAKSKHNGPRGKSTKQIEMEIYDTFQADEMRV